MIFAKCPIPGKSKTRLIPLLGEEGSVRLAKAMLSDVLKTIDGCVSTNNTNCKMEWCPGLSKEFTQCVRILEFDSHAVCLPLPCIAMTIAQAV